MSLPPKRPGPWPGRCLTCYLRFEICVCSQMPKVETRTRFFIVRHCVETWKTSNTARFGPLALPDSCGIADYGLPGPPFDDPRLHEEGTYLLFPGDDEAGRIPSPPPKQLVIVDGSWSQARRMVQRMKVLHGMPRLSLPPPLVDRKRLRRQKTAEGMSTLEAIAEAVALLEGEEKAAPLFTLHDLVVERILSLKE